MNPESSFPGSHSRRPPSILLETPLRGRFIRERLLVFAPPNAYLVLVAACLVIGLMMILIGLASDGYWLFVGCMVVFAGCWGAISLNWITFDVRNRTYTRRDGASRYTKFAKGSLNDLEAIFVLAEDRPSLGQLMTFDRSVVYRIVLQWHGLRLPSLILEQDYRAVPKQAPLNAGADFTLLNAARYAEALGLPLVNHTHVSVSNPVPHA